MIIVREIGAVREESSTFHWVTRKGVLKAFEELMINHLHLEEVDSMVHCSHRSPRGSFLGIIPGKHQHWFRKAWSLFRPAETLILSM